MPMSIGIVSAALRPVSGRHDAPLWGKRRRRRVAVGAEDFESTLD